MRAAAGIRQGRFSLMFLFGGGGGVRVILMYFFREGVGLGLRIQCVFCLGRWLEFRLFLPFFFGGRGWAEGLKFGYIVLEQSYISKPLNPNRVFFGVLLR